MPIELTEDKVSNKVKGDLTGNQFRDKPKEELFYDMEDNKESLFSSDGGRNMFESNQVKKENLFDAIDDEDSLRKSTPLSNVKGSDN